MAVRKLNVGYYIPMSVIVALVLDYQFGTARFLCVKHKASSNAFPLYRSSSLFPHKSGPRSENDCKNKD